MFASTPRMEITIRVLLSALIVFNALVPTAAFAASAQESNSDSSNETGQDLPRSLPKQEPVFYDPPAVAYPQQTSPEAGEPEGPVPPKEELEFTLVSEPAVVPVNGRVIFHVNIRNHSEKELTSLIFTDAVEAGLEYVPDNASPLLYDPKKKELTLPIATLKPGEEYAFDYSLKVTSAKRNAVKGKVWLHTAVLKSYASNFNLKAGAVIAVDLANASAGSELAPLQAGGGWNRLGRVAVHLEKGAVGENALVMSSPTKIAGKGPALQFELAVYETGSLTLDARKKLDEQSISLTKERQEKFKSPAFLEINLDGYIDLTNVPAGQEPYVATYDEAHKIWVKVPILETDPVNNSVTVEAAHFSTWGAGLGSSLPQNGANVLLFDQPYTSLFTGSARYSLPVWTPPGRAGMQPDLSLSYSSGTVDGVLGDVQAPWVGVGWNIDDVEIVRKITTDENGYGYRNEFALTLNGSLYQLVRDEFHQNRFFTDKAAFLYIERHNYALDNQPSTVNTTGEWWEVVTTDGTRYRLGWNEDSEQLALMYGYSCTTEGLACITPDGAYASLGYAGKAKDLVVLRWRVDRVSDTHGNYMEYGYDETQPDPSTTLAAFDRESYLQSISYTGFDDPEGTASHLDPAYQVVFNYGDRATIGDVPTEFNIWDNIDSKYLSAIWSCYGDCASNGSNAIRKYEFGYSLANVPNPNGTLTLTSLKITGGGFTDNGQSIPSTSAPTIHFTYQDKDNRASGNGDVFQYPRLATIDNGSGGLLTFTYEHDGRANNSWYNYRVQNVTVDSGMGVAKKQSYVYVTPVYTGQGGNPALGELIGYTTVTESLLDFANNDAAIVKTKHTFGTTGLDIGREMQAEVMKGFDDTVLRKTTNVYVTDNSGAPKDNNGNPFPGWNYRYLGQSASYERSGGSLALIAKNTYYNDPYTGNPLVQSTYLGNGLYRKMYYEYLTNPGRYILDKVSRTLLVDAANQVYSDTRYHYDGQINQAPTYGDVTLVQRLTGDGIQTIDTATEYNIYGSAIKVRAYRDYGTVNSPPSAAYWESTTTYDTVQNDPTQTYPMTVTNALGQSSSMAYLPTLGVAYQAIDPNGWTTSTTYDGLGRTLSVTPPGLAQPGTWYIYPSPDTNGRISAPHSVEMQILDTIAGKYRSVWGIYDGAGRMLQTQVDAGDTLLVSTTLFNAQGLVRQQSLPYEVNGAGGNYTYDLGDQFTTSEYDALGRVTRVVSPGSIESTTSYDGLTTTAVDPNGNKVSRTADGLGRMISVAEYSDPDTVYATTSYFYDSADRLVQVKDAKLNNTTIQYDWLGRKLGMDDPDMGVWSYAYDSLGNMGSQTDARGHELTFVYDALNRLTTKSDDDPNTVDSTYTYGTEPGTIGMRIAMTDPSGSSSWSYSNFGRTVTESRTIGGEQHSVTTRADWLGRAIDTTYDDGEVISYTYDALGRPDQMDSNQSMETLVDLAYNVLGQISTQTLGNGTVVTNDYDDQSQDGTNRLLSRTVVHASTTLLNLSYEYDANGNITQLIDGQLNETQFYEYDFLNRLTSAIGAQGTPTAAPATPETYGQQFEYDQVGNILQLNNWGTPPTQQQGRAPSSNLAYISYPESKKPAGLQNPQVVRLEEALLAPAPPHQIDPTETPTETPTPTATGTSTATNSPTATSTPIPTNTSAGTSTPSGTPSPTLTPTPRLEDPYTVSLLNMNGADGSTTFTDQTGITWTRVGNAQIDTAQSMFGGASGLFDGSGDYITAPDSDDFYFNGDFTIDFRLRLNSNSSFRLFDQVGSPNQFLLDYSGSGWGLQVYANGLKVAGSWAWTPSTGVWYHVALVRSGNEFKMFVDGTQIGSTVTDADAIPNIAGTVFIGANYLGGTSLNGWLDEVRVSRGSARWTSNFTPPTSEYSFTIPTPTSSPTITPTALPTSTPGMDDAYTVSLLHMNGTDTSTTFADESGMVWTASGNAQIDTAQSMFGGASGLLDGSGDYLGTTDDANFNLGADDFTFDFWMRPNSLPASGQEQVLFTHGAVPETGSYYAHIKNVSGTYYLEIGVLSGSWLYASRTVSLAVGTWYHIAFVRSSGSLTIYVNGVAATSTTRNESFSKATDDSFFIGAYMSGNYCFNGWIDEFRFSKGIARWTSDFTPPPSEYAPGLLPQSLLAYWDFEGVTGTIVPDVAVSDPAENLITLQNGAAIVSDGANGSAVYFDGSNDSATVANHTDIKRNGSFTLSTWIHPSSLVTNRTQYIINKGVSATDFDYGFLTTSTNGTPTPTPPANVDANGKLVFRVGDLTPNKVIGPVLPVNTWTLVTGVYDHVKGELRLYINGTLVAVEKVTGTVSMGTGALSFSPAGNLYHGKLDEVRFYNRALTSEEVTQLLGAFPTPTPLPSFTPTATTTATLTPTPTPLPASAQQWGTGDDNDLTVSGAFNINANTNGWNGRSCADGVSYSVTNLASTRAYVSPAPATSCLAAGDEVMLINLQGVPGATYNTGTYEFLRVASIGADYVQFTTMKMHWYGSGWRSDSNIGTGSGQQKVMLMRVPNYNNVTVNGTLTGGALGWGGMNSVVAFRVKGTLNGNGVITASALGYGTGTGYAGTYVSYVYGGGQNGTASPSGSTGGGGGYATNGQNGAGLGGRTYGRPDLSLLFPGGGGGLGGVCTSCEEQPPASGGSGGGIVWIAAQTINFQGSLTANGTNGQDRNTSNDGGAGAGGSIRIEGATVTLNAISAAGATQYADGGLGRIAIYYQDTPPSITSNSPAPYIAQIGAVATPTPSPTPVSVVPSAGGTGADGDLNIASSFNLNAQNSGARVCDDGGDAVTYSIIELSGQSSWAKLSTSPASGCLKPGDEVLIINLQGTTSNYANVGRYEFLHVGSVIGNTVYFTTAKVNFYGANAGDDSNLGTSSGKQRVMLMRVPNYRNVTVNGTLYGSGFPWGGSKGGVVAFRVSGTLSGSGAITVSALGYDSSTGFAGSYVSTMYGGGGAAAASSGGGGWGGGGGYGTGGANGSSGVYGGSPYGQSALGLLFPGGGGGKGGDCTGCDHPTGGAGGTGGGILWIGAETIDFQGSLAANGANGYDPTNSSAGPGGGGAGGSIRIEGATVTLNTVSAAGGPQYADGGLGRIAIYYSDSFTNEATICAQASTYCKNTSQGSAPTPTATVTPTNTATPTAPVGWYASDYTYSTDIPHAVTSVERGSFTDSFTYDDNGNMTCRTETGVTYLQTYSAENRIASIQKLASGTCAAPGNLTAKWDFTYDGDGVRTGQSYTPYTDGQPGTAVITRYYFGGAYEVTGSAWKKYYSFGGTTLMRDATGFKYFLSDHLGSVAAVLSDKDAQGNIQILEQQRYLPFGGVRTDLSAPEYRITNTDFTYTGQRDLPGTGLMDYKARFYSPSLGRFIQPDSIIPGAGNSQSWNRYSYVKNNPIIYNDPTGHYIACGAYGEDACRPHTPRKTRLQREEKYGDTILGGSTSAASQTMATYVAAGIQTQNPLIDRPSGPGWRRLEQRFKQEIKGEDSGYTGVGPAKITDQEMETAYGDIIKDDDKQRRGVGLGLREPGSCTSTYAFCEPDQLDPDVANLAMELRISLRTKVCENHGCTPTDIFIVAALAENGSIYPSDIRSALENYPASGSTAIDWATYLVKEDLNNYAYNRMLIGSFSDNVLELQEQGYYVPNDIDWEYTFSLQSSPDYP